MLKNIEKAQNKGVEINPQFLKPELYSFQIPPPIMKGLGLLAPGERRHHNVSKKRSNSRATSVKR